VDLRRNSERDLAGKGLIWSSAPFFANFQVVVDRELELLLKLGDRGSLEDDHVPGVHHFSMKDIGLVVDAEPFRAIGPNDVTERDKLHRASGAGQPLLTGLLSRGSKHPQPTDATVRDHVEAHMGYRPQVFQFRIREPVLPVGFEQSVGHQDRPVHGLRR